MSAAAVATATSSSTATLSENGRPGSSENDTNGKDNSSDANSGTHTNIDNIMETEEHQSQHQQEQENPPQQAQQQLREQDEARLSAPAAVEPETSVSNRGDNPLPSDLRRIISEVARTGTCSWLSWNQESRLPEGMSGASSLRSTITSSPLVGATHSGVTPSSIHAAAGMAVAAAAVAGTPASAARQSFAAHRRSPYPAGTAQPPPRKKHRNGLHKSTRRRFVADGNAAAGGATSGTGGRKRPLFLIRTTNANATGTAAPGSTYSAGSVGSGRTSGSEPDDSTQYECDSDTTNSEISFERRDHHLARQHQRVNSNPVHASKLGASATPGEEDDMVPSSEYKTLQEVFRVALGLVLDHFYRHRGGYKLSPAEKRRNETLQANSNTGSNGSGSDKANSSEEAIKAPLSPETIFQQRRQRLVMMLLPPAEKESAEKQQPHQRTSNDGPPFTIQRIAEVLVAPERYYTQSHKLCNCLEKLLLVSSSTEAFGGSTGGDTSQSRREERELAALVYEKERQKSELRQRRLRRRQTSPTDELMGDAGQDSVARNQGSPASHDTINNRKSASPEQKGDSFDGGGSQGSPSKSRGSGGGELGARSDSSAQEMLEAAARASLRTKFDHVGIDPHSSAAHGERDVRSIAENRGMTNSPPPPSLAMASASNMALPGHGGVAGFVRQHLPEQNADHPPLGRVPSPILFPPGSESALHATTNMHMLQLHHAAALAGVSIAHAGSPLDLGSLGGAAEGLEVDHASNSDADSESDDVSLDDSASDRSDGSDSGSATHHEPFTAARAMALNRMQQQQRLQSRALTSLNSLNRGTEGFRPPADSEYQSGDSMDSMRAEDSGGSDSSSSDLAD